jgi:hypothetical protein
MPRAMKPRPAMVVRPSFVSQENCFAVLGVTPRKYLELIVPGCDHASRLGKTVCVPLDEAEHAVLAMAVVGDETAKDDVERGDDDQPRSIDDVLRAVGRERA